MGRTQQRKGRGGELELCRILNAAGLPVSPGEPVSFGGTPDIAGLPGVHIECKRVERLNLRAAMEQLPLPSDCNRCAWAAVCNACPATVYNETGAFDRTADYPCAYVRAAAAARLACLNSRAGEEAGHGA